MAYSLLNLETSKQGIARVTLNRPEVHNAFDEKLIAELTQAFDTLDRDPRVRLAVLAGEGKSFCAGADLNWMKRMKEYSPQENMADGFRLAEMYKRIANFSKPLIGVVQGAALGGGSGLVAVCDYAIAAEDAQFGFTEVRLGLVPGVISPFVIAKIGAAQARAHFLSGAKFSSETAYQIGLIHRVVPVAKLEIALEETLKEFLKAGPEASRKAKTLIANVSELLKGMEAEMHEALAKYTVQAISNARVSPEGQEGMSALLKGKKPSWVEPE